MLFLLCLAVLDDPSETYEPTESNITELPPTTYVSRSGVPSQATVWGTCVGGLAVVLVTTLILCFKKSSDDEVDWTGSTMPLITQG